MVAEEPAKEIRFTCDVDCDGGGLDVAMAKDDKSAIVQLEVIEIWDRNTAPKRPPKTWSPATTTRSFASIASTCANARSS